MGMGLSFDDATFAATAPVRRDTQVSRGKAGTRRGKQRQPLVRVPMLDWPSNLFSDNVSAAELAAEDFPIQWDLSSGQYVPASFFRAAA